MHVLIREALKNCQISRVHEEELITIQDMQYLGLSGNTEAKERREYLTERLNIGYANATQLRKKLNRYSISPIEIKEILNELDVKKQ